MPTSLENLAYIEGTYEQQLISLPSNLVAVRMMDITVLKRADRTVWRDGALTFTIEVINSDEETLFSAVCRDRLDPTRVTLEAGSVTVNGIVAAYDYNPASGDLVVNLPDIAPGGRSEVSFRVVRRR